MYHKNEYPSIAALCAAFLAGSDLYPNFFLQCRVHSDSILSKRKNLLNSPFRIHPKFHGPSYCRSGVKAQSRKDRKKKERIFDYNGP